MLTEAVLGPLWAWLFINEVPPISVIFGGGIIPDEDIKSLKKCGVKEIFGPGTTTSEMIDWINSNVQPK